MPFVYVAFFGLAGASLKLVSWHFLVHLLSEACIAGGDLYCFPASYCDHFLACLLGIAVHCDQAT